MERNQFKAFQPVLVRNDNNAHWKTALYSNYNVSQDRHFCDNQPWKQVIPANEETIPLIGTTKEYIPAKYYAVMFFYHWTEIGLDGPEDGNEFILKQTLVTTNHLVALTAYAETRCPASILLEADNENELNKLIHQTKINYQDKDWLETNVYPTL